MDNSKLKVRAAVDLPSPKEVDRQIRALENNISKLKVSGKFDDTALKKLTNQLDTLKATVTTVNFSPTALKELTGQVENALKETGSTMNTVQKNTNNLKPTFNHSTNTLNDNAKNVVDSGLTQSEHENSGGLVSWFRLPTNSPFLATVEFSSDAYEF